MRSLTMEFETFGLLMLFSPVLRNECSLLRDDEYKEENLCSTLIMLMPF